MRSFVVLCALVCVAAASELRIPVVQANVILRNGETIKSSQMGDLLSVLNGYTILSSDPWKGLKKYDPLHHPTLYLIADFAIVDGVKIEMNSNLRFPLENDEELDEEFNEFRERSIQRMSLAEGQITATTASDDMDLDNASDRLAEALNRLKGEKTKFDPEVPADKNFLMEYNTLFTVYEDALNGKTKGVPSTVYWVNLDSIKVLNATYGPKGEKTMRAAQLFGELIGTISGGLESKMGAMFMVILETEETELLKRTKRQAESKPEAPEKVADDKAAPGDWNLDYQYGSEYHIVFAISIFVVIVMILAILAVSVGLWFMDPGRDSIIYRMTSSRMKID